MGGAEPLRVRRALPARAQRSGATQPVVHHVRFAAGAERDEIVISTGSVVGGLLVDGLGDGALLEVPGEDVDFLRTTAFGLLQVCAFVFFFVVCLWLFALAVRVLLFSPLNTQTQHPLLKQQQKKQKRAAACATSRRST